MPTPHKHAAVIKAWADGHKVQMRSKINGMWEDVNAVSPRWMENFEYRVKPNTIKYRNYLYQLKDYRNGRLGDIVVRSWNTPENVTSVEGFIRWIGDWQEAEV